MEYIRSLDGDLTDEGCFLCRYWASPNDDPTNHVVWRGEVGFVVMNRFPYTNGHLLVATCDHVADLADLDTARFTEFSAMIRDGVALLASAIGPHGFNIGYNIGRCAGAGLPGHLHAHIVPRWDGDTNFMAVLGGIRVVPDALDALYPSLCEAAERAGLRSN